MIQWQKTHNPKTDVNIFLQDECKAIQNPGIKCLSINQNSSGKLLRDPQKAWRTDDRRHCLNSKCKRASHSLTSNPEFFFYPILSFFYQPCNIKKILVCSSFKVYLKLFFTLTTPAHIDHWVADIDWATWNLFSVLVTHHITLMLVVSWEYS